MKRFYIVVLLLSTLVAQGQQKSSVETRALMQQLSKTKSAVTAARLFEGELAVSLDSKGGATVRAMAKLAPGTESRQIERRGVKVTSRVADIVALRLPLESLAWLEESPQVVQYSVCHKAKMLCDKSRVDAHVDSVQQGLNLPQSFKGDGVLVGICDWGFDYQHPNINSSAEKRILAAWDQFKLGGPAPEGFDYGTVYYGYDELKAAMVDTSNIYQYNSHGTHCAGIIGGRGTKPEGYADRKYIGMAPHVQFLCGSWLLDEASWMDQVAWMNRVAKREGKRLVISNSWGMYSFSCIDGTSLASQALNHYAQDSNIVFVTSGGNNGDANMHISHTFPANDTLRTFARYYPGDGGQMLICWGMPGEEFQVGFGLSTGLGGSLVPGPYFSTTDNIDYQEGFLVIDNDTVHYNVMTESSNPFNQRPHVLLKVDKENEHLLHMFITAPEGSTVHAWNINYVREHESNIGMDFTGLGRGGYSDGDHHYGIGEPACAEKSIAVAAHRAGTMENGEWVPGDLTYFSSYGPILGGGLKPDISAVGWDVISSVSSWDPTARESASSVQVGGRVYKWASMSGTSMSGPVVAGSVALMLQANDHLTVDEVKDILARTATNDSLTGDLRDSVSLRWGHGKINTYAAVCAAIDKLSIDEVRQRDIPLELFPNPASGYAILRTNTLNDCAIEVFSLDGRKVVNTHVVGGEARIDLQGWQSGLYVVRCHDRSGVRTAKLIVQ